MNFSGEDRKEVFFFFEQILRSYKQPVYYENLRGHISNASVNIRKYVLTKCKGDNFLEYFKRRKNYFYVEDGKISLKEEFGNEQPKNSHFNKSKKKTSKGKFVRRSTSFTHSSYASALKGNDSSKNEDKEYETDAITYFRNRLIRKKKERLWSLEFDDLPKKIKRHLQLYHKSKVKSFLSYYPNKFVIDSDDETVTLAHFCESNSNAADCSSTNQETCSNIDQNSVIIIDSEIKKASDYLECVIFFIDILKKLNQPFPIEKLGGYFSQARKEIKDHLKINYRSFKFFFDDAPLIFLKNTSEEVSLSKEYRKLIRAAENLIKDTKKDFTLQTEMPLKSQINHIFQPRISSQRPSCLAETNKDVLSLVNIANTQEDTMEETLKLHNNDLLELEMTNESTDDFFDNYLMRSSSQESSDSLSSKSTQSISVKHPQVKDYSVIKVYENFELKLTDKELMENTFLRCIFTVELFCLEFVESELNYIQSFENKAIKYFMDILDSSATKLWKLSNLQGSVGNNREIAQFMNKFYKGEKLVSFFQKHHQFEVDPPFVKIALSDKGNRTEDFNMFSNEKNMMNDLVNLYELNDFKILLRDTYTYLSNVCEFCKDKNDVKIERLCGILSRFPSCLNMIKSLKGQSLSEKNEYFLQKMMIFQFSRKGYIFFPYDYFYDKCRILFSWFEKMQCYDPLMKFVSFSDFWKANVYSRCISNNNRHISLEKSYQNIADIIENEMENRSEMNYCELAEIIPENVLFSLTNGNYFSRYIISSLLESGKYRMKDGKISLLVYDNCNLGPSDTVDNVSAEIINEFENHIFNESSRELYIQQNICDNQDNSVCSPFTNINNHSEYKVELGYCSKQSSEILQTTEYSEMYSKSVEFKSDLSLKDDKVLVNHLISEDQHKNFNSTNDNHISEPVIKSFNQEKSKDMNVFKTEENLCIDVPVSNAENFKSGEKITVFTKPTKSVSNNKEPESVVEESGSVFESSSNCYSCEDKVNIKIDLISHNSDAPEKLSISSLSLSPEFHEFNEFRKENQNFSFKCDLMNTLISEDLSKQEDEFDNDQALDLNLTENYVLEEKCISVLPEVKPLEKDNLTEQNVVPEVTAKNASESNIEVLEMEQNISCISQEKEVEIHLLNKQNSYDNFDASTEMISQQPLHNLDSTNKEIVIRTFEHFADENINLKTSKAFEQVHKKDFQCDASQTSDFNDATPENRIISVTIQDFNTPQELQRIKHKDTAVSVKQSFTDMPEELFDTSLIKQYLSSSKLSEEMNHPSITIHDAESVKESVGSEVPLKYPLAMLTSSSDDVSKINKSRASSCNDLTSDFPLQPITAKVVLLTNSSCLALADIKERKQSIYFMKYAFACEHQDDCSDCFSILQIGDEVSCFVPLTEIPQKIWIAFMVTKENSECLNEFILENAKILHEGPIKSLPNSACIKSSTRHFGCQTEFPKCDNYCQTDVNANADKYQSTKEISCQTRLYFVRNVSIQTENITMMCMNQNDFEETEIPFGSKCVKCQTYFNGDLGNDTLTENTDPVIWQGKKSQLTKTVSCQTFSTGQIMMLKHHPM
ncbi:hypothetical protein HNY73_008029 [Argiope bruennichi]|uniref:Uncharacterized protein n=1 Tax=Argiope bruennichi TaxID=94029 RepID=A0A8T0F501_ARGBR|nr:hypothetical protein HNY73_008029 [Argiope bruennichi]